MTAAYILMQLNAPDPRDIMESIRAVAGVKQAHLLAGPTDCIAYVEATDQEALAATIIASPLRPQKHNSFHPFPERSMSFEEVSPLLLEEGKSKGRVRFELA
jgi:hypothetical protein